jgi:hypothetical protein
VVSPKARPLAMSRIKRRMILPLRVLGSSAAKRISSDRAIGPIFSDMAFQLIHQSRQIFNPCLERDKGTDRLAFEIFAEEATPILMNVERITAATLLRQTA